MFCLTTEEIPKTVDYSSFRLMSLGVCWRLKQLMSYLIKPASGSVDAAYVFIILRDVSYLLSLKHFETLLLV